MKRNERIFKAENDTSLKKSCLKKQSFFEERYGEEIDGFWDEKWLWIGGFCTGNEEEGSIDLNIT